MASSLKAINYSKIQGEVKRVGSSVQSGSIMLDVTNAINLLQTLLLYKHNVLANDLGIYAIADRIEGKTAYWTSVDPLEWVTVARPADCARTAITDHTVTSSSKDMCKNHVFLKFCKDTLVANLSADWTALWGAGNDLNEILSTPAGVAFLDKFIERNVAAVGNDFTNIVEFGNHTIITSAVSANINSHAAGVLTNITNTFATCDGRLKQVDALKTTTYPHINNSFVTGTDFSGANFIGDALTVAEGLRAKAHADFGAAMDAMRAEFQYPICECSGSVFEKLTTQIMQVYPALASSLQWVMNGTVSKELNLDAQKLVRPDAFLFKGILFVARYDWDRIASKVGFYHHRMMLSIPQNFGVAIDIPNEGMPQFDGMGMVMTKSPAPTDGGAYFFETNYRVATALLKHSHVVNYSVTATS